VLLKIRPCHLAARDERHRAREQPQRDHDAADEFDDARQPALRGQCNSLPAKNTE
jgi:hypothetical protein